MPPFEPTIAEWTPTILQKWLQDILTNQPPSFLPLLRAETLQVEKALILRDLVQITKEPNFRRVGATGQPAFENSWVAYGSGWGDPAFWKDPFGIVRLRGLAKSGTVGQPMFTLPPGFRPAVNETFPVISNSAIGRVDVQTDGKVIPQSPSSDTWVSLSGIAFRTS